MENIQENLNSEHLVKNKRKKKKKTKKITAKIITSYSLGS